MKLTRKQKQMILIGAAVAIGGILYLRMRKPPAVSDLNVGYKTVPQPVSPPLAVNWENLAKFDLYQIPPVSGPQ